MSRYKLVIFDMDGTLINSEPLGASTVAAVINSTMGLPITGPEFADEFGGRELEFAFEVLHRRHGVIAPADFGEILAERYREVAPMELKATEGAFEALAMLGSKKKCVASNGQHDYIEYSLEVTNTAHLLDATFSFQDVDAPKPAPDLFLHAARSMGVDPEHAIVLEDRDLGVEAAIKAGMKVVGFIGNNPKRLSELEPYGIDIVDDIKTFAEMALE